MYRFYFVNIGFVKRRMNMFRPEEVIDNLVLDVREKSEWEFWNCRHAKLVPLGTLPQWLAENQPPKDEKIYVFCRSGNRSEMAKNYLVSQGYSHVINLGGLDQLTKIAMLINEKEEYEGKPLK